MIERLPRSASTTRCSTTCSAGSRSTRLPDQIEDTGWEYGIPIDYLRELVEYWRDTYDWRGAGSAAQRARALPHRHRRAVDPLRPRRARPTRMRVRCCSRTAGPVRSWSSSTSSPGSRTPRRTAARRRRVPRDRAVVAGLRLLGTDAHARAGTRGASRGAFAELMHRLGYARYGAQGGDWGAQVTTRLGALDPEHCAAIHLNMPIADRPHRCRRPLTDADQADLAAMRRFQREESGYANEQSTKPQTLGVALNDSPAGLLAWIVEKFRTWSDCDGHPENVFTRDQLLTNVMLLLGHADERVVGPAVLGAPAPRLRRGAPSSSQSRPASRAIPKRWCASRARGSSGATTSRTGPTCRVADTSPRWNSPSCSSTTSGTSSPPWVEPV